MEFQELLLKRKSIRKFKPDPVPDEYITGLLEAARLAPSGTNIPPWRFVLNEYGFLAFLRGPACFAGFP